MEARLNYHDKLPDITRALLALNKVTEESGLERSLIHLMKLRASQINGCAFCIDMHSREARADGETEQRLYLVSAWRDSPLYTPREQAALAWVEAVTNIRDGVSDALFQEVFEVFPEEEIVKLTAVAAMINTWNRFSVSFGMVHPVTARAA